MRQYAGGDSLGAYGHSKDHRADLRIEVKPIGLYQDAFDLELEREGVRYESKIVLGTVASGPLSRVIFVFRARDQITKPCLPRSAPSETRSMRA